MQLPRPNNIQLEEETLADGWVFATDRNKSNADEVLATFLDDSQLVEV